MCFTHTQKVTGIFACLFLTLSLGLTACSKAPVQKETAVPAEEALAASATAASTTEALTTETPTTEAPTTADSPEASPHLPGQIYLYGEHHGDEKILNKELELWNEAYHQENMRHLFVELPCYTADFLNIWMQSDGDEILDALYDDWKGSAAHNPYIKLFYQTIKRECPETVFHGTDVGHQYPSTGERYLAYLKENGQEDSEQYRTAQEVMEQGRYFYDNSDSFYRENQLTQNFTAAFDRLDGESIMGFYGSAHIGLDALDITGSVPCMANQLKEIYGDVITSEDLFWVTLAVDPIRTDTLTVNGKDYKASYFGKQDLTGFQDYSFREFWRLEDAYEDFKSCKLTGDELPYDNYPMVIETGQVFVITYTRTDGSVMTLYYRSDGTEWQGKPSTAGFTTE